MMRMRGFTVLVGVLAAVAAVNGQVREWTTYSGDMLGQRHSPLTQITAENVKNLELQWVFQSRSLEKFEATPLVVDGVMYTVQPPNDVVAMDAATGRVFWTYPYIPSPLARLCCGRVNRGLAIHENTLYMATIDGRLIAIDAKTGQSVASFSIATTENWTSKDGEKHEQTEWHRVAFFGQRRGENEDASHLLLFLWGRGRRI